MQKLWQHCLVACESDKETMDDESALIYPLILLYALSMFKRNKISTQFITCITRCKIHTI